ncbi:MAG: type IV toxin-antitoxin system AbiEi family antitoxin [Candidatus Omnitrophica bacterium]|nr:type IV toxin-antitoxin system AbiEi family antitoxin [Syntrophales bacterium]MDD5501450.1 type IV toxin-antitoxin system AbiEi family antitoxin [Candidatus Omnitrophota bacterium]
MTQNDRTLGKTGSELLTEMTRQKKRIFTFKDAAKAYGSSGQSLRELLSTLVRRGWLQRVEKGKYLILPFEAGREREWTEHEFIIASYLIQPYYIGFRSALNYYGYTEQVSRTVFIASTRRKQRSSLEISGVTYRFVLLSERKFFGFKQISIDGYQVNISEPEKTIVDCLDQLRYCGGISEVAKALWYGRDELDFIKMAEYSRRNGNRAASQRLGYLIEMLGLKAGKAVDILLQSISNRYAVVDTLSEPKGKYIDRWKVIINVSDDELSQWKEQR